MKYKLPKIEELFDAGTHYGHQVKRWHPKMAKYIYTAKDRIHIINLEMTEKALEEACDYLYEIAKKGGQIIFVGTKRQARGIIEKEAKNCGALFVNERWLGGTITNFKMIKKNIDKLLSNIKKREAGEFNKYTKKERLLIDREIDTLNKFVGGLTALKGMPAALFIIDPRKEKTAVKEAVKSKIPVISLVDTNSDPSNIDIVIPGNDDAIKSVSLILGSISEAIEQGYKEFDRIKDKIEEEKKEQVAPETEDEIRPIKVIGVELTEATAEKEIINAIKEPKPAEIEPIKAELVKTEPIKTEPVKAKEAVVKKEKALVKPESKVKEKKPVKPVKK